MNALQFHILCAVCAAARAIDAAKSERKDLRRDCGGWKAEFEFEPGGMSVGLSPLDRVAFNAAAGNHLPFNVLDAPLKRLTGDETALLFGVPIVTSLEVYDETVLASLEAGGVTPPKGFDWRTWEPEAVPA